MIIQVTIFAGLVLCTTHLSEITLIIAANAMHTFFLFTGKPYWWLFTDKLLNTDTMIRLTYLHYVIAFFLFYLGLMHGVDMHYDWKAKGMFSGIKQQLNWWDEALSNVVEMDRSKPSRRFLIMPSKINQYSKNISLITEIPLKGNKTENLLLVKVDINYEYTHQIAMEQNDQLCL